MSYERVTQFQSRLIIGTKQTLKAMRNGEVMEVVIAKDAEEHITNSIVQEAVNRRIPYEFVESKKQLGVACNIDVAATVVAIRRT